MGPRTGLSTLLILGALALLSAIFVGNGMGNRVLRQVAQAPATLLPITTPSPADVGGPNSLTLRRRQVTTVATDPAFPDPRVTPEPTPQPTPRPIPKATRAPTPLPTPPPEPTEGGVQVPYTSPPLAYPLVKHSPGETSPPDDASVSPVSPAEAPTSSP